MDEGGGEDSVIVFVFSAPVTGIDGCTEVNVISCLRGISGGVTVVSFFIGGAGGVL